MQEMTRPFEEWGKEAVGYMLNSSFSADSLEQIQALQNYLEAKFPDSLIMQPVEALHITLMDWIAPLVDYGQNKDELFRDVFPEYDQTLKDILEEYGPIEVSFFMASASTDAVIVKGIDDGSYQEIRDAFIAEVDLQPNTKQPPKIIHSTIARFAKPVDLEELKKALVEFPISFEENIEDFRLVRESKIPMLEFEEIQSYKLEG